ncbi:biofilm regulation diguanylate cyclase SiaD [Chitinilyticum litopenaei]|uniref:biofilm regulation diguanylate cyclase SiaD n=1 Tax=Chitinilyticum litopenaei TaxID=1121276 RepID=UPI000410EB4F|nr:biofilm regulation diguanylate cyclase SiaD [Chitinilyticum litopenaei]
MSTQPDSREGLERDVEAALADPATSAPVLQALLGGLYDGYRERGAMMARLMRIADQYQLAERERGQTFAQRYERQLRQLEKIVRISDQYQHMLRELNNELQRTASHDLLTGLYNRRYLFDRLTAEQAKAARGQDSFAVAMADIDFFKQINDRFGHDVGDAALCHVASVMAGPLREYDLCGRWGGEEFLLLFPGGDMAAAERAIVRIREQLRAEPFVHDGESCTLTLSFGCTAYREGETITETLKRVDEALYRAKSTGRDRLERV